jgi:hypothetical protein
MLKWIYKTLGTLFVGLELLMASRRLERLVQADRLPERKARRCLVGRRAWEAAASRLARGWAAASRRPSTRP